MTTEEISRYAKQRTKSGCQRGQGEEAEAEKLLRRISFITRDIGRRRSGWVCVGILE